jgi:hypothetical protein
MAKAQSKQLDFGLIITDPEAHRLEMKKKGRTCLSCSQTFQSTGPGNRICSPCKELEAWTCPAAFSVHTASF